MSTVEKAGQKAETHPKTKPCAICNQPTRVHQDQETGLYIGGCETEGCVGNDLYIEFTQAKAIDKLNKRATPTPDELKDGQLKIITSIIKVLGRGKRIGEKSVIHDYPYTQYIKAQLNALIQGQFMEDYKPEDDASTDTEPVKAAWFDQKTDEHKPAAIPKK